ncbi:DUF2489 domain-containing protein [Pontibacter sp. JAM-7]|uniref:DUF2489 domain-containing protein n=1 Tax=Pontibacter sp. JAM-7 TaxID=3366581 RepID=UPI003AF98F98
MSESVVYSLIAICVLVIVLCVFYLLRYWRRYKQRVAYENQQQQKLKQELRERRAYLVESVQVIARAVGHDDKLTLTEACMRLSTLLESLSPELVKHPEVAVLREMHNRTSHIPIKEGWQKLSKQEQWRFKQEMVRLEQEYETKIHTAAGFLAAYDFSKLIH